MLYIARDIGKQQSGDKALQPLFSEIADQNVRTVLMSSGHLSSTFGSREIVQLALVFNDCPLISSSYLSEESIVVANVFTFIVPR